MANNNPTGNIPMESEQNYLKAKPPNNSKKNSNDPNVSKPCKSSYFFTMNEQPPIFKQIHSDKSMFVEKGTQEKQIKFVDNLKDKMKLDNEVGSELTDFECNRDMRTGVICLRAKYAKVKLIVFLIINQSLHLCIYSDV